MKIKSYCEGCRELCGDETEALEMDKAHLLMKNVSGWYLAVTACAQLLPSNSSDTLMWVLKLDWILHLVSLHTGFEDR